MTLDRIGRNGAGGFQERPRDKDAAQRFRSRYKTGQIVTGVVLEQGRAGQESLFPVRVGDTRLMATAPFTVRAGQRLLLEVERLEPEIVLRCLRAAGSAGMAAWTAFAARRADYEKRPDQETRARLEAAQETLRERLSIQAAWRCFPPRALPEGRIVRLEAASWPEPGTAMRRCLASASLETASLPAQRLFLEGLAKPPQFSWRLAYDPDYPRLPEALRQAALSALAEAVERVCAPGGLSASRCLGQGPGLPEPGETGAALLARFGCLS